MKPYEENIILNPPYLQWLMDVHVFKVRILLIISCIWSCSGPYVRSTREMEEGKTLDKQLQNQLNKCLAMDLGFRVLCKNIK